LPVSGRDKRATWQTTGALCSERHWSRSRLIHELQNGMRYRTFPEGHVFDWHDCNVVQFHLKVKTSEVEIFVAGKWVTVFIEVLPPMDPEVPAPSVNAPAASPAPPRKVSEAELRQCLLDIVKEHPPDTPPLSEEELIEKVEGRLGVPLARDRILAARSKVASHFKLPVGRPRK
jgi:hypothetical protein